MNPSTPVPESGSSETSLWDDIKRTWKQRRQEWRIERSEKLLHKKNRGQRINQNPRGFGPRTAEKPLPEALEPGFDALKIWIFLFLISASFLLIGVQFGGRFGLVLGFVSTLLLNLWILVLSPNHILRDVTTWNLEGRDTWGLLQATQEASDRAHITPPTIALADSDNYFCLSAGISPSRSTIVISHALVEKLSREELRLIISFEVAKIACQWTAAATAARGLFRLTDAMRLSFLSARLLRLSLGRGRIFKLDEWVASHGESRELWARTLWTLEAMIKSKPRPSNASDSALDTVSVTKLHVLARSRYDRTLPNVRSRIGALIDRYPP